MFSLCESNTWLVTGCAGFIGSNLVDELLRQGQTVIGLDNLSTGYLKNIEKYTKDKNFTFFEIDIRNYKDLLAVFKSVRIDYVLHQAALGSVPRSVADPITTHEVNTTGFLNVLHCAKEVEVKKFVYAASSSTYGDSTDLPKREDNIGNPLSPYAITKYCNELYSANYQKLFGLNCVGLRYFNVFGPNQDPDGAYAAVIPKWIHAVCNNERIFINGDGNTSRDFCFIKNVIYANLRAAVITDNKSMIYNVACGEQTSLNALFRMIVDNMHTLGVNYTLDPIYKKERVGDVKHSLADISRIKLELNYTPDVKVSEGILQTCTHFLQQ